MNHSDCSLSTSFTPIVGAHSKKKKSSVESELFLHLCTSQFFYTSTQSVAFFCLSGSIKGSFRLCFCVCVWVCLCVYVSMCVCVWERDCVVTTIKTGIRASEMTKAIFRAWQPQDFLDREERTWGREWAKTEMEKGEICEVERNNVRKRKRDK